MTKTVLSILKNDEPTKARWEVESSLYKKLSPQIELYRDGLSSIMQLKDHIDLELSKEILSE